jgi:cation diffusion facilitator family transporter
MAVVADGWHMSTHAAALSIAALSYRFARKHAHDPRFSFGTGKLGELAGFSSAIILALVALFIGYESVTRLLAPVPIQFGEATIVAVIGLGALFIAYWSRGLIVSAGAVLLDTVPSQNLAAALDQRQIR